MTLGETNEEFQILNGLTNEESKKLNEFKQFSECKGIPDQYLLIFLFSKKFDLVNCLELVKNNLFVREKLGISLPVVKSQVNSEIAKKASSFTINGKTDKQGRSISYLHPSKLVPKKYDFNEYMTFLLWSMDQTSHIDSSVHRNGLVVIEDLANISIFKHFDTRLNDFLKKHKLSDMQSVFPGRIQAIYILNAPFYVSPLLKLAKTFVKNKIISRVQMISSTHKLFEHVDQSQVLIEYGGTLNVSYPDYFDSLPPNY